MMLMVDILAPKVLIKKSIQKDIVTEIAATMAFSDKKQ
jgi:hypothetical protein